MRLATTVRIFFVIYCFEAGFVLILVPWMSLWDRTVALISFTLLRSLCLHPLARGALSGFGLIHLVWGLHDLTALLTRRDPPDAGPGV